MSLRQLDRCERVQREDASLHRPLCELAERDGIIARHRLVIRVRRQKVIHVVGGEFADHVVHPHEAFDALGICELRARLEVPPRAEE